MKERQIAPRVVEKFRGGEIHKKFVYFKIRSYNKH